MSDVGKAVFLSYASQDADAARRIAEALRAFGVEVWFDQSELRGGDAWDQKIRKQIHECALFLAIISKNTDARSEGYFRREWKLAIDRTHDMAEGVPFIVPVVVDDLHEASALVPAQFQQVQWMRLPGALPSPQFVGQVKRMLALPHKPAAPSPHANAEVHAHAPMPHRSFPLRTVIALGVVVLALVAYVVVRPSAKAPAVADKSLAVLPFANMSPDPENAFFADGVHEDVITNLAKIRDLKVISRTSVLAYRDPAARNLRKIAAELGVATVLEGSVRRDDKTKRVRVTAQLIDARTDQHLWAETYDRELTDVFAIQSLLAREIAAALKANLTGTERALIERRPTQNQEAYDLYLRAQLLSQETTGRELQERRIALYEQAVAKDPSFALAYAALCNAHGNMYWFGTIDPTPERKARAQAAMEAAKRVAPDAPETRMAEGIYAYFCDNDWSRALVSYRAAEAGLPNDARLLYLMGLAHRRLGQWSDGRSYQERALSLNPLELSVRTYLLETLWLLHCYAQVGEVARRGLTVTSGEQARTFQGYLNRAQYELDGDRAAYDRAQAELARTADDPTGPRVVYNTAMQARDYPGAQRALADPRQPPFASMGAVINDPVALHQALVAFLQDQKTAAQKFADEAIAYYRTERWTHRQEAMVMLGMARAAAYAGRADEAVNGGKAALALAVTRDAMIASYVRLELGRIYAALGRREEALATLREAVGGPCQWSPNQIRADLLFSRLKEDPRFEEILRSTKPL